MTNLRILEQRVNELEIEIIDRRLLTDQVEEAIGQRDIYKKQLDEITEIIRNKEGYEDSYLINQIVRVLD